MVAKRTEPVVFKVSAFDVVPLIVAFIVPSTVKFPVIVAEPVIIGSNIFIIICYYSYKYSIFGLYD